MGFSVRILADSVAPNGVRLTTMEWTFPRVILAEVNTHRMKSSNAASSRAIPFKTMVQKVLEDPFIPVFRRNKKGMQAGEELVGWRKFLATWLWLEKRNAAVRAAKLFGWLGVHKQYVNRLLEPWMYCTIIISATDWTNIFALRCHPDAEPSFQKIAYLAFEAMKSSEPRELEYGQWHLPLLDLGDRMELGVWFKDGKTEEVRTKVAVGRCARVSYLTHDGKRDFQADIDLTDRLAKSGHWSPFEHVATPAKPEDMVYRIDQLVVSHDGMIIPDGEIGYCGNFRGWKQARKFYAEENITELPKRLR